MLIAHKLNIFVICMMSVLVTMLIYTHIKFENPQRLLYKITSYNSESECSKMDPFDAFISRHPVFGNFKFRRPPKKKNVNVLVIVSSAPKRIDRRQIIRQTWWKECKSNKNVSLYCIFLMRIRKFD